MRYPKDVEIWEHAPGRKLAEVVVRVKNVHGALMKISQAISESEVNMLTGFFTAPGKSNIAMLSFFADFTNASGGLSGLKKKLHGLEVVESVDAIASEGGFMVDKQHFPVQWAGRKAVVMGADGLTEMLSRLWTVFGSGAVTIIEQMAEAMGRHSAKEIIEDFGATFAAEQLDELIGTYSALGYADVSIERTKSSDFPIVVNAKGLFECEANAKQRISRRSAFFRAHLRGFMSTMLDMDFEVNEVQCLTAGDEVCSFRIAQSPMTAASVATISPERTHQDSAQPNF
jgi:predicted hydrocarbon binding protein